MARFFGHVSLLWAFTSLINVGFTVFLLLSQSIGTVMIARSIASTALNVAAVAVSIAWFRLNARRQGFLIIRS